MASENYVQTLIALMPLIDSSDDLWCCCFMLQNISFINHNVSEYIQFKLDQNKINIFRTFSDKNVLLDYKLCVLPASLFTFRIPYFYT